MSIKVNGLTKIYEEQKAVNNISFEIESGNIVGFLGPNGAGKSTTMKMLTTYITPTTGSAEICGYDISKHSMDVRMNVGYLPESNPLYFDMYVREYLMFVAKIHKLNKQAKSRVNEMIEMTGLQKEINKKIGTLSKGYKQRIGLAQALIHDPQVIILDEPTSGLDPNQITEIRNVIVNIGKNKTVLLSTHIMQEVQAMCNRVIIINNGQIVADDAIDALKSGENSEETLIITLGKQVEFSSIQNIENVEVITPLENNQWMLTTKNPELLRRSVMSWAVNQGIDILSMQKGGESLESIFKNLTKGK